MAEWGVLQAQLLAGCGLGGKSLHSEPQWPYLSNAVTLAIEIVMEIKLNYV